MAPTRCLWIGVVFAGCLYGQTEAPADSVTPPAPAAAPEAPVVVPLNEQRILKIMPDYQTVENSHRLIAPMTPREKWNLVWRNVADPFNNASALFTAAMSQADDQTPNYGRGSAAFGKRLGAGLADFDAQTVFSGGLFPCLLHQDPRYFRKGPSSGVLSRAVYSLSRIVIIREDSGRNTFNSSNFLGMAAGIGFSNVYYPSASRTESVMVSRIGTSLMGDAVGNLLSEFWPDIQKKFFQKKQKN
jgi:hypothetical protein